MPDEHPAPATPARGCMVPPSAAHHSRALDVVEDELNVLHLALRELVLAVDRGGPASCVAAHILSEIETLKRWKLGVQGEAQV